jgi:ferrous iron transport protein B
MNWKKKADTVLKIVIVGLPNTGKTQLFNNLTGTYNLVANYPSTTVREKSVTTVINGEPVFITDTPGFRGLYSESEEELYVRNLILTLKPDVLVQCMDANRLKQSLYLAAQLLELGIPMIVSLNVIDETIKMGKIIDSGKLSALLGIPVVECIATEGKGTNELKSALNKAKIGGKKVIYFPHFEQSLAKILEILPENTNLRNLAARLILQKDPYVFKTNDWLPAGTDRDRIERIVSESWSAFNGNFNKAVNNCITKWIYEIENLVLSEVPAKPNRVSQLAARLSRHPVWGIPILLVFLGLCYFSVVYIAGFIQHIFSEFMFNPVTSLLNGLLPDGFFKNILIGKYGVLTLGVFNAIGTVLPVLSVFFFLFGIMEDIGYLPNLGILVKRMLNRMGLSGKSIMPLILGFGCKTMATLTVRSIPSRKEKIIAVYLIAFAIPCSAQLALIMAILGKTGLVSLFIYIVFLAVVEFAAGMILNKVMKDGKHTQFIQELPPFRLPRIKALLTKTGNRLLWFLKEAAPVFIIASLVIFFIDLTGILRVVKDVMSPVIIRWLGLPIEMVDALLLTLARNEIGAGFILNLADKGMLSYVQSVVAVVLTTMFVPCIANVVAMVKEMGIKLSVIILLAISLSSLVLAGILRFILAIFIKG